MIADDNTVYIVECDIEKRSISVFIPKNSPYIKSDLYTAEQKEEMIISSLRPHIRELI